MNKIIVLVFALLLASSSAIAEGVSRYQMDLDRDGRLETIVAEVIYNDEPTFYIPLETKISIMKSDGSLAAESKVSNGYPEIKFVDLNSDGAKQVAVWTSGGAHYTNLNIFEYRNGKITELFSNGSACKVEANLETRRPTISVGRASRADPNWSYAFGKELWNVYSWNGKAFVFDAKKSTTKEITEAEEILAYTNAVTK